MNDMELDVKRALLWRNLVIFAILLTAFGLFFEELKEGLRSLVIIVSLLIKYKFLILNAHYQQIFRNELGYQTPAVSFSAVFISVVILFSIWMSLTVTVFIVAQFTLPVIRWEERKKAFKKLEAFLLGQHGPAIFVKEGKQIARQRDRESSKSGVILVDASSAIVLAQQENSQSWNIGYDGQVIGEDFRKKKIAEKRMISQFTAPKGPGLVFTESGNKIFSVLDLRRQSRSEKEVEAYTRNGIKIQTTVTVSFSLSDQPEIIVGYVGDTPDERKIYGLIINERDRTIIIKDVFELPAKEVNEIYEFIERGALPTYSENGVKISNSPYVYYPHRVWAAAHSQARSSKGPECLSWHQIPIEIAVDRFRAKLASVPYDDLFLGFDNNTEHLDQLDNNSPKQILEKIREEFSREIRLKGSLSYQFIVRKDGQPFIRGMTLNSNQIIRYPRLTFSQENSNILRKSGIAILSAGFGQIVPTDPRIQMKLVENWKAKLEKEIDLINAEYELEAVRVRNRNRAQIQQEMTYLLSSIFQSTHTEEALALRVFQALEVAATNPANKDLSPKEILNMLQSLHKWLLVDRKDNLLPPSSGATSEIPKNG